jgi:uncharacterized protein
MAKPKLRNLPDLSDLAVPGTRIAVRATPKAARTALKCDGGRIAISVTVAPEAGKANEAVRAVLAAAMRVAPSRLTLTRGQSARDKQFIYD